MFPIRSWLQLGLILLLVANLSLALPSLENHTREQIEQVIGECVELFKKEILEGKLLYLVKFH